MNDDGIVSMEVADSEEYRMVSAPVFEKAANYLDAVDRVQAVDTLDTVHLGHMSEA